MNDYPPPVAKLFEVGEEVFRKREWLDYRAMGIGPEHIPHLIRLAQEWVRDPDEEYHETFWERTESVAPVHAWRALGQLRAVEAVPDLLELVRKDLEMDGDFASEDMPEVFAKIGSAALPTLIEAFHDTGEDVYLRWHAVSSMTAIAKQHPETRDRCVALFIEQLDIEDPDGDEPDVLNGGIIADLIELRAVEAAPRIERAFEADRVDPAIAGDWEQVRYLLGLGPRPARGGTGGFFIGAPISTPGPRSKERSRNRKKLAKQSKKKNRKKKKK